MFFKIIMHRSTIYLLLISILICTASFAYSQTLNSLDPDTGTPGTVITITGTGFPATGLRLYFRSTTDTAYHDRIDDVATPDGQTITYTIPSYLRLTCHYAEPPAVPCAAPYLNVIPGVYEIYVENGSTESNRLSFVVPPSSLSLGDVNGDSVIDIIDGLLVAQYYVGLNPTVFYPDEADVNASGSVDIVDALLIAQYYVGLITQFPGQA